MMNIVSFLQNNIWLNAIIVLLPILGWIIFFQHQNRERRKYVFLAFLAGMMSVIPIKIYEKYWGTAVLYFEHLNLFQYLSDLVAVPSMTKLLAYLTVSVIVAAGLFLFTALLMFILEVFSGDNTIHQFQKKLRRISETPLLFVFAGVLVGVVAFTSFLSLHEKVWFFLLVGMLEEYIKHLCLRFADEDKIVDFDDAISFSIIVALGFAFLENVLYLHHFMTTTSPNLEQLGVFFILRSTVSVLAHVCFSAIFGYFYGLAHFSHQIYMETLQKHRSSFWCWMHKCMHGKAEVLFHEEKMMEGMLVAMILHAVFNTMLEFNQVGLMIPMLLIMFFLVLNLFHRRHLHHRRGHLRSPVNI